MCVFSTNDIDFIKSLKKNNLVIVNFFADWCMSCRIIDKVFIKLSEDKKYKNVVFLKMNAEKNPIARNIVAVDSLPFFSVFKKGVLIKSTSTSKEKIIKELIEFLIAENI
jgi:thioredoxin 1